MPGSSCEMTVRTPSLLVATLLLLPAGAGSACRKRGSDSSATKGEVVSQPGAATPKATGNSEARIPTQGDIYQATRKFMDRTQRPANTLEELVAAGLLAPLPEPPLGKKYVLDQRAANLRLVDR